MYKSWSSRYSLSWILHTKDTTSVTSLNDSKILYNTIKATVTGCITISVDLGTINQTTDPDGVTGHLTPGCYIFTATATFSGRLSLDGPGQYTFNVGSTFITGAGAKMVLATGALKGSIFWAVGSSMTIGSKSIMIGTFIANEAIGVNNSKVTGSLKSLTSSVNLASSEILV